MVLVLWDASALAEDTPVRRDRRWSVCWLALTNVCCVRRKPRVLRCLTRKAFSQWMYRLSWPHCEPPNGIHT